MIALLFALEICMAKPPEPLEEILPLTQLIVDAVVVEVKDAPGEEPAEGGKVVAAQVVVLQVNRVVRGKLSLDETKGMKLVVHKPRGAYKLRTGVKGPWLLSVDPKSGARTILGRYGPDSWTFEKIELKLKELDPPQLR